MGAYRRSSFLENGADEDALGEGERSPEGSTVKERGGERPSAANRAEGGWLSVDVGRKKEMGVVGVFKETE